MNNLRGAKIIYQESKATQPSHLYFLQKDENYCEAIVTSESGAKRKLNFNVDLSNFYTKSETYSKIEINDLLDVIEVTKTELDVLISENNLEPNRLYKITGVESWCFSQHLIKAIYLKSITNNTLESEGVGEFYTPKYNDSDSNLGIWKGELLANGMIDSASYNIGDKVIWGNLFWENISGEIGSNIKRVGDSEDIVLNNYLSETDWQLITSNDDESLYNVNFNIIKYDLINDYIYYREDDLGNKYELSYGVLLDTFPNSSIINLFPEFIYDVNSIALFQWNRDNTSNNIINESIVLNCNYNTLYFKDNVILDKTIIERNNFLGISFIGNKLKRSYIYSNFLKTHGNILYNDLENSKILANGYYIEISYNVLNYNSEISNNNDYGIILNDRYSKITTNNLYNNSKISLNVFVEEGKEVDDTIKSIYGNELINNCSINNNTIKNGSTIFGHKLEYYSTINGNTLDIESNIYNNQVVQNGKIDNNILTGHGRIYGNQLDRASEITLCKLRISPISSYATTIKSNRLFAGKIQNIDFGDIINPVGTNPNDPAFGGNELSECIIENESIIKDLTFPNHGGVGIQFVKMNGYSEFKNITVNDIIRNVDFINTIFNDASDYSKLIEGNGYQTNGFTKTYIDGVLLQDRLDEKQDVLNYTPEDVTNKSDSYTASSSTTYASTKALVNGLATKLYKGTYTGTAQDLKNNIDGIQIGSRNLLSKINLKNGYVSDTTGDFIASVPTHLCFKEKVNCEGKISMILSGLPSGCGFKVYFSGESSFEGYFNIINNNPISIPEGSVVFNIEIFGGGSAIDENFIKTNKIKLEFGNKATDWTPAPEDKQDRLQDITGNVGVGKTDSSATEKLDVNGNIKALQVKDQYGTLKSQRVIPVTGDITLSEIHNGAVLNVTNTCNITIPTGLDANFQCVVFAKGSVIVTFVNGGVTVYAPSGLLLKTDKMASLISTSANNFNLTGELATS